MLVNGTASHTLVDSSFVSSSMQSNLQVQTRSNGGYLEADFSNIAIPSGLCTAPPGMFKQLVVLDGRIAIVGKGSFMRVMGLPGVFSLSPVSA